MLMQFLEKTKIVLKNIDGQMIMQCSFEDRADLFSKRTILVEKISWFQMNASRKKNICLKFAIDFSSIYRTQNNQRKTKFFCLRESIPEYLILAYCEKRFENKNEKNFIIKYIFEISTKNQTLARTFEVVRFSKVLLVILALIRLLC